jgi:DNA-binding CsgD family transcriptional regulator
MRDDDHHRKGRSIRDTRGWHRLVVDFRLSRREQEIVECLLDLDDNEAAIGARLGMSKHTVHTHLARLFKKLAVGTRCQLVARLFAAYVAGDIAAKPTGRTPQGRALSPD